MKRRDFLVQGAALAAGAALPQLGHAWLAGAGSGESDAGVALICDPRDPIVSAPPARWAVDRLRQALVGRGVPTRVLPAAGEAAAGERLMVIAGAPGALGRASGVRLPTLPEALAIASGSLGERRAVFALGSDVRGLLYAVTELAEQAAGGMDPSELTAFAKPVIQAPANRVRSVLRQFASDVEDKPWFNDRDFWPAYFGMLVTQRFNRVNLTFGLGYDFAQQLKDTYFYFAYPFLVKVPGYDVRAVGLPDAERDGNLEMLRFISDEAAAKGLDFQLGLWTHAYVWQDSPDVNYVIEGLTPETHASYCRDALSLVLRECPNITGVTLRIHGESGVPERSWELWRTIFGGVKVDRPVSLDLHSKGIDQETLDAALSIGVPVSVSPKFWAEHMGLPYHQADIRPNEIPPERPGEGLMARSTGDRSFTRYGYADLLREDRPYDVLYRIWPGTQRVLLWSDPAFAAAYGRAGSFGGGMGIEIMEPLSFKGRKGSGLPGGRAGYAEAALRAPGPDFEKYRLTYATWGPALYDPEAPPDARKRGLAADYGPAADDAGAALARASRILPLFTTAHLPSAANNLFWAEMYVNMPVADPSPPAPPYDWDSPAPRRFGTVTPLDPQLFSTVEEFADELLAERVSGKHSPAEVARWLEEFAAQAETSVTRARDVADRSSAAFRRMDIDTQVQIGLGRFFAWKLRAATLYALHARTGNADLRAAAVNAYRRARAEYGRVAEVTTGVYVSDVTYGPEWYQRGHWSDRLAAIDRDIAAVERGETAGLTARQRRAGEGVGAVPPADAAKSVVPVSAARASDLVLVVLEPPERPAPDAVHTVPNSFTRGGPVELALTLANPRERAPVVTLHYRHLTQAERWLALPVAATGGTYRAAIPAAYTDSSYPVEYYFEVVEPTGRAWLHPGLGADLAEQPYFVLRAG